ncbi:MAG: uracil phosphoribosyltransferase [Runella slithyformis]|nr:MAG: uracil phosphoribosyltransferase [Runella slithyformis]TAF93334.1 MAG: uracil phosphoribosyltransferase [Runella sp.]TAG24043.1 MAG: uracil phosphoribosyltransferase [Cytophagales bacterium]TAG34816.1 MAG: uracil phosphoribosyltransferase [Cytophagia bacterium]TAE99053.1 MAG: uracil phosphoribosyltransferase [Runella slithyformis]
MFVLTQQSSVANHFLAELRDVQIQQDRQRFRRNLGRLGELLAYEISKTMAYKQAEIETSLGKSETQLLRQSPVLATILRASLPFHQGFLNYFDAADSAFIGAYRGHHINDDEFEVEMDYITAPDLNGRPLILMDPMLATGRSIEKVYHALLRFGIPSQTHIAAAIASPEGVRFVQQRMPQCRLWLGAIDKSLNAQYYIVPGLGDAGDLAFGPKM